MKKINITNIALTSFILFICWSTTLLAHGSGASFERVVNGLKIDIGYDPEIIVSGDLQRFDFELFDSKDNEVDFEDVWVKISEGDERVVFASGIIKGDINGARMSYTFPKEGKYYLYVRYDKSGKNLAESSFSIDVVEDSLNKNTKNKLGSVWLVYIVLSFIAGFTLKYFLSNKR